MDKKRNIPSKFSVPPFASDDEIWIKILELLTPSEQLEASPDSYTHLTLPTKRIV